MGCSGFEGQADVVLGERGRGGRRGGEVVGGGGGETAAGALAEGGAGQAPAVGVVGVEGVQQRGHPPGEVLGAPDPLQAGVRVGVQQLGGARLVEVPQGGGQQPDVRDGQVEPLGPGGRHDVGG